MIEIIMDASQIETFETCPQKWYKDHIQNLETNHPNPALSTGSFYHEVFKYYYSQPQPLSEQCGNALRFAVNLIKEDSGKKYPKVCKEAEFHIDRLRSYFFMSMHEDDQMKIIAVEKGFSYILYEDAARRYILEGMIDLIYWCPSTKLTVRDHKTQSREDERYPYNHQVSNYLNFTKADYFEYNYVGLQQNQTKGTFHKGIFAPPPGYLEQWVTDVTRTFKQMEIYLKDYVDMQYEQAGGFCEAFPRRRAACHGKYGICQFHKLCQIPDNSPFQQIAENSAYKVKDVRWRAWA